MQLSDHGARVAAALAQRYGISPDAVRAMMDAVARGGGQQAQFSHPELGGMGQWQRGGMIMVGDMFNSNLQALVSNLCNDISAAYAEGAFHKPQHGPGFGTGGAWWPQDLGQPSSTGMQNDQGYAIFPGSARLAILRNGVVRVFDTGAHRIGGVGQQQSLDGSVTFTSQLGPVLLSELREVKPDKAAATLSDEGSDRVTATSEPETTPQPGATENVSPTPVAHADAREQPAPVRSGDVYEALAKLGALRDQGILTDEEFQAKKTELLARI